MSIFKFVYSVVPNLSFRLWNFLLLSVDVLLVVDHLLVFFCYCEPSAAVELVY